jgi:hypothetical protein
MDLLWAAGSFLLKWEGTPNLVGDRHLSFFGLACSIIRLMRVMKARAVEVHEPEAITLHDHLFTSLGK